MQAGTTSWKVNLFMTRNEAREYIKHDLYRNLGTFSSGLMVKAALGFGGVTSFLYSFRMCQYYSGLGRKGLFTFLLHALCYARFRKLQYKYGIELNQHTQIGYGLRLPHRGGIVIHPGARIGNNCEIMQGVTIGNNIIKDRDAVATIGDNVLICAGAKIIGAVKVGNNVVIGANAVVTKNVPDNTIVAGVPATPIGTCDDRFVINRLDKL